MATNSRTAISLAELKAVASSLQSQKDTIYSLYKNNIVSILESTRSCSSSPDESKESISKLFSLYLTSLTKSGLAMSCI